jgi:hypothetical protein
MPSLQKNKIAGATPTTATGGEMCLIRITALTVSRLTDGIFFAVFFCKTVVRKE